MNSTPNKLWNLEPGLDSGLFLYWVRRHQRFFQLVLISWMVTVSSYLIWQIISFILPPYEYGCVYAWTMLGSGPAIDLQKITILAKKKIKIIFSDKVHFDFGGYVNKQNCLIWGTENPHAYIEKPTHSNEVKNCTNHVRYCMPSRGSHLNEIIFHY